jgi:cell division protease FtsH
VSYTLEDLLGKIKVAVGGRVAEEVAFQTITTGVESDLQQATLIARQMVGRWGMSEAVGLVTVTPPSNERSFWPSDSEASQATQELIDSEIRRLIETAHRDATDLITEHRAQLDSLAHALLSAETLDEADAYAAAGLTARPSGTPEVTAPAEPVALAPVSNGPQATPDVSASGHSRRRKSRPSVSQPHTPARTTPD